MTPPFQIRTLGEIAIRCKDFAAMVAFYGETLGLQRMPGNAAPGIVFFRIAEEFGGHTQVLALFETPEDAGQTPETGPASSLHHIALSVAFDEQDAALAWFETHGLPCRVEHFGWVGWRGIFTQDPDGNTVELVAFDASLKT